MFSPEPFESQAPRSMSAHEARTPWHSFGPNSSRSSHTTRQCSTSSFAEGCDDDGPDGGNCLSCVDSGVADAGQDAQASTPQFMNERGGADVTPS